MAPGPELPTLPERALPTLPERALPTLPETVRQMRRKMVLLPEMELRWPAQAPGSHSELPGRRAHATTPQAQNGAWCHSP
jgi:hypothetical protein